MITTTPERGVEPKLLIPALEPFYGLVRELSWPVIRLTHAGGVPPCLTFLDGWP